MVWLLKLLVIWFSIDVVVIATGWYALKVIRRQFPNWWRQVIVDDMPENEPEPETASPPVPATSPIRHP
jgi:hypothetical protein